MDSITDRITQRFAKAVASLDEALALEETPKHIERDAALLWFELAAELMPKVLRRILSEHGSDVILPKDVVREAHAAQIINEAMATTLLAVIDDRNRMVHDYSEVYALELLQRVRAEYAPTFQTLGQECRA